MEPAEGDTVDQLIEKPQLSQEQMIVTLVKNTILNGSLARNDKDGVGVFPTFGGVSPCYVR